MRSIGTEPACTYQKCSMRWPPDQNSQLASYRAGQIDITDTVPSNAIPSLRSQRSNELVMAPYLATAYYALNLSEAPFASNLKLR